MSDSDDIPELVDSSDDQSSDEDETEKKTDLQSDNWLLRDIRLLERQDTWFRVFCLGPCLYGVEKILPGAWIKALSSAKLLLNKERQRSIAFLQWQEWECLDLMDHVVLHVSTQMRDRPSLSQALRCVQLVEPCLTNGLSDDVDKAIKSAGAIQHVTNLWTSLMKHELSYGKERATKFAVLYAIKIYSEHVLKFDFVDSTKKTLKRGASGKTADELKREGNSFFKEGKLQESINCYTEAAKKDPFHHVYYGNRAQAYNKLTLFNEALADGRRAVTIRPDFAKGYYRYAVAFHELGRLDSAITVIETGIDQCEKVRDQDVSNLNELRNLKEGYTKERYERNSKHHLTPIPKHIDERLNALPSSNNIELEEKFGLKKPSFEKPEDDVPPMVSSDSDSDVASQVIKTEADEKPEPVEIKVKKKSKSKQKPAKTEKQDTNKEMIKTSGKTNNNRLVNGLADDLVDVAELKEEARKKRREEERRELTSYLSDGSDSMLKMAAKNAMVSYQKALDMLSHHDGNQDELGLDETDLVTLKYACGMSAISTGLHKNIIEGIERFQDIIQNHQDVRFPPAYFGLGKAYVTLNRFSEAMEFLRRGIIIATNVSYVHVTWPGSKTLIEETDPQKLVHHIEELLQRCKFPPQPDAVCRYHTDDTDSRTVIYLSDPDFKGFVKIMCQMDCIITFHTVCWKSFKTEHSKQTDKDMLDTDCPTPDCTGVIIKIEIIRQDSLSNKEHISERYAELKEARGSKSKPNLKQKPGEAKQAKKHEKKEARKQKRRHLLEDRVEERAEAEDEEKKQVIVDGASASAFIEELKPEELEDQALPDVKDTVVYKKDDPMFSLKQPAVKSKKSKKKKDKTRQIINLEVNFSDRKEETLMNENDAMIEGSGNASSTPFSVPSDLQSQISTFEKSYTGTSKTPFKPDEITENLFSFFVDILTASGPLAVDDQKVQQELDVFPVEALEKIRQVGGLADFLRQSLKFAVIDDVVSLMSDAVQAREYALKRRSKQLKEGGPPLTQNSWQTVGRKDNIVDSLGESVKQGTSASVPSVSQSSSNTSFSANQSVETGSDPNSNRSSPSLSSSKNLPTMQQQQAGLPSMPQPKSFSWAALAKSHTDLPSGGTRSPGLDALDSIEDAPVPRRASSQNRQLDDLDDFDAISDSGSEYGKQGSEPGTKPGTKPAREEDDVSNSSSRSDISDSFKSDFSADQMPKPLRPLNAAAGLSRAVSNKNSHMWDKLESDFDMSWKKTRKEEHSDSQSVESVGEELRHATEEFVRKSDEKFVSELAVSVVDKMYTGKKVSENQKQQTLQKVSSEIWKDFERSASTGKLFGGDIWANTPAGGDYSANMGKFANDFMKKHYEKLDDGLSSDAKTFYPPKPISPLDTFNTSKNNSRFTSPVSPSWSREEPTQPNIAPPTVPSSSSFPPLIMPSSASASTTATFPSAYTTGYSGYNLFSGPTWGLDSFNKPVATSTMPNLQQAPPLFIRPPHPAPPHPAASYYQNTPVPPGAPPFQPPFSPLNVPSMPPPFKIEKIDKEVQCSVMCRTTETMTEPYEPLKKEFLMMREERDQALKMMIDAKAVYEKLVQQFKAKEQQVKLLEGQLGEEIHKYTVEKKRTLEEREILTGEIIQLKDLVSNKTIAEKELWEKMTHQEQRVNEIARLAKEQREKDLGEIKRYKEGSEMVHKKYGEQIDRARKAEVDILKTHLQNDKSRLGRSQKEATYHVQHLGAFIKKHQEEKKAVPPQLQAAYDYWLSVQEKIEEGLKMLQTEYEGRMEEVRGGKQLTELEPVRIPSLPPLPDYLKSMLNQSNPQGLSGFMMPRMPGPAGAGYGSQSSPTGVGGASNFPALPSTVATPSPPRPVSQAQRSASPQAPRPLSGARAPLAPPSKAPLRTLGTAGAGATGGQGQSSYEKLMAKLHSVYPRQSRAEFGQMIQDLRKESGGSLSGMTMEDIVNKIDEKIGGQSASPSSKNNSASKAPPGLNPSWAFLAASGVSGPALPRGMELFDDEEDPCVICHEEMEPSGKSTVTLECNHRFHDECIRKWFQEQSTCPNCRVHTLLADEFPSLG